MGLTYLLRIILKTIYFGFLCILIQFHIFDRNFPESFRVILSFNSKSSNAIKILSSRNIRMFSLPFIHHKNIQHVIKQSIEQVSNFLLNEIEQIGLHIRRNFFKTI